MKKAFTLIEIVIVLVIIGILMGVTMQFGSNRLGDLKSQASKDKFVDGYMAIYAQNMASSYHQSQHYTKLDISIGSGVFYAYDGGESLPLAWDDAMMSISGLRINDKTINEVNLSFVPYHLGCSMDGETGVVTFQLVVRPGKTYCLSIVSETCGLRELACK